MSYTTVCVCVLVTVLVLLFIKFDLNLIDLTHRTRLAYFWQVRG